MLNPELFTSLLGHLYTLWTVATDTFINRDRHQFKTAMFLEDLFDHVKCQSAIFTTGERNGQFSILREFALLADLFLNPPVNERQEMLRT